MNINKVIATINNPLNQNLNQVNKSLTVVDNDFKEILTNFVSEANKTDLNDKINNLDFMLGNANNTHDIMIAGEKADLALRLTIQIRNKVIDAYTEVMRMQV